MNSKQPTPPIRVRLYSHVTKTRFLHVEDALNIGKVRLFAGAYSPGQGMSSQTSHYLDIADARIVFHALLNGEQNFSYKEYKGTPPPSPKQAAVSRVLSVAVKGDQVYIELKQGPGQVTPTGAITPNGRAETEVNVSFKLGEARRLAAEALAYLHAWDVYRLMTFQQVVGKPLTYALSAPVGDPNEPAPPPVVTDDEEKPVALPPPRPVGSATRPVTRKGPTPKANGAVTNLKNQPAVSTTKQPAPPVTPVATGGDTPKLPPELRYGDGLSPSNDNVLEVQTFRRYLAENGQPPASKAVLQAYYRQRMAT